MDFTARMLALLEQMRRERNGAVADAMRFYGAPYGLNYGVSLPTLRQIALSEQPDPDFARYLFLQEVRELRLAALYLIPPSTLIPADFTFLAAGIVNSEIAEEAAFALLSRAEVLPELFRTWTVSANPLLQYAALLAAARTPLAAIDWADTAAALVHRNAAAAERTAERTAGSAAESVSESAPETVHKSAPEPITGSASDPLPPYAAHLTALGAVALLAALASRNEESRRAVLRAVGSLGKLPAEDFVHEELAWRLEV